MRGISRRTGGVVCSIVVLGLISSLPVSEVAAAQSRPIDRKGVQSSDRGQSNAGLSLRARGTTAPPRDGAANHQVAGPSRSEGEKPAEEEKSADKQSAGENQKSASPVGVAPQEKAPEILPSWMVQTFDLPGAGVLTPKGTLIVEPYLQYAHLSNNRVTITGFGIVNAAVIGRIDITGVSRDIYTASLVGRYGITNRFEIEVRVPYLYREDSTTTRPQTTGQPDNFSIFNGSGLGDIETTGRFQLNQGGPEKPYFVAFTRFKSTTGKGPFSVPRDPFTQLQTELPTGSGFYIFQPGLTFLFPSDPVVIFGSMSFIYNKPRDVGGDIGRVDPGSGGNANVGLGLSLNEKLTMTFGYDHTVFARPTSASNVLLTTVPHATQIGVVLLGGSYRWSDKSFVNLTVGVGVTREAPDLQVTFRMPTAFSLWK